MFFKPLITLIIILFMPHYSFSQDKDQELIPREILFGNPDKTMVRLSRDGKYISYLAAKNDVMNVFIAPFDKPNEAEAITNDDKRGIGSYSWSYDNKHIIFTQDNQGDENTKLYSYNLETKNSKLLTPEKAVRAYILKKTYEMPNQILIGLNDRNPQYHDIYKLNLDTGETTLILKNDEYRSFIADSKLNIRFAARQESNGDSEYFEYKDKKFIPFMKFLFEESANSGIFVLDKTAENLYIFDSRNRDKSALISLNIKTNQITTIAEGKKADISIFTVHPREYIVQGVSENFEKVNYKILDESIKPDIDYLAKLDDGELNIIDRTLDDKKWLIAYSSDIFPIKYYYYDRDSQKATYLFSNRKLLESYKLAPMHPVIIKARDGLELVNYLTIPNSVTTSENLKIDSPIPMVLFVHGGPWHRDYWGLNNVHQWLANRGYAVLSVNYRGSDGFGKAFSNAGNLQWGKKMHDDLIDTVNWAIDQGIADKEKIAIYGGSYGGYATLAGLTLTPNIFACGVDLVGPSNLITLAKSFPPYWASFMSKWKKSVGNHETAEGEKALLDVSPITHVDKITKPLLIAQGDNDPRVTKIESDQIYDKMISKNLPVTYIRYPEEGHGFLKADNRKSFMAIMEKFLAKFLHGKLQPLEEEDFTGAKLIINNKEVDNKTALETISNIIAK